MTEPFRLDMLDVLQYFHDQLVPRLELIQESFDRYEFHNPALQQLQDEVRQLTRTAEQLEEMALHYGEGDYRRSQSFNRISPSVELPGNLINRPRMNMNKRR